MRHDIASPFRCATADPAGERQVRPLTGLLGIGQCDDASAGSLLPTERMEGAPCAGWIAMNSAAAASAGALVRTVSDQARRCSTLCGSENPVWFRAWRRG